MHKAERAIACQPQNDTVPRLRSESEVQLDPQDAIDRITLADQLRLLPTDVFTRLQYFQPQIGCVNRCTFCCQAAGRDVWQFTRRGLRNFIASFAHIARERSKDGSPIVGRLRPHRPGTLFPYLDNDIASYPYLDEYISLVSSEFQATTRIATVGYSSLNPQLQAMHTRIVRDLSHALAGIRFSFTPYTAGWAHSGDRCATSRAQFMEDFANMLRTYRAFANSVGFSRQSACTELRFAPLVSISSEQLIDCVIEGRHVLRIGPHLCIESIPTGTLPPISKLERLDYANNGAPVFTNPARRYILITSDSRVRASTWQELIKQADEHNDSPDTSSKVIDLYRMSNCDGHYYVADPTFQPTGQFHALHIYPKTASRQVSGYTDATRFLLNGILQHKASRGISRREQFAGATEADVRSVIDSLYLIGLRLKQTDALAARHVSTEIIPLVEAYTEALRDADYPPATFFDRGFTVDTGQIVNQGRALPLFKGLATTSEEPMTPHEERGYGEVSWSVPRGHVWRIAPAPYDQDAALPLGATGAKNPQAERMAIRVEELDCRHLRPQERATGKPLRQYMLQGGDLEHMTYLETTQLLRFPGIVPSRLSNPVIDQS
jgi:hypothetical protein